MGMRKEILIAVAGLTPQIVTETLYYLTQVKKPKSKISEIYVITTFDGKREILTKLLDKGKGRFFEFCRGYRIDSSSIKFDERSIILLMDSKGNPLRDIRSVWDNELVADQITEFIREKSKDPDTVLHCSVAGGRKTMSIYLAYALMLFGRPQDTLSHVLVDEKLERNKEFFYPKKSLGGKTTVDLAEIPYVKLRDKIKNLFGSEKPSFSRMVKTAQREIDSMPLLEYLEVNLKKRCLRIGEKEINLNPKHLALYSHYAERRRTLPNEASFEPLKGKDSINNHLNEITNYILAMRPDVDLKRYKFASENFLQDISKINKKIENALDDPILALQYKITAAELGRTYGATRYGIRIDKSKIKPLVIP
ncbi:MAG: TIGR02584 family CRISPR-associated protein [Deltaproteobacteria bacterium]|nr:TIGR02584 family CRISPR-associated protein [Deltaproteobacteria bacterium]